MCEVINMIEELLMKLKEEAAAEADHKQWCDKDRKPGIWPRLPSMNRSLSLSLSISLSHLSLSINT